jgi:8-hydroxy-5-deazaflavin:NADPH oxidoreductase
MKVGILGSGVAGQVLAKAFSSEGHETRLGTRNPAKEELIKFSSENPDILVANFADVANFGEILVLATGGSVTEDVIRMAGDENFSGKVVIDVTNPIAAAPPEKGVLKFFTGPNESLMERLQKVIPDARLVKAFNSVGNTFMYKPQFQGGPPTMFICGNDADAKNEVTALLTDFGWETEDMGSVEAARAIEPLCILWCIPGMIRNQWTHAFKLLKL